MELDNITPSEISQSPKTKGLIFSLISIRWSIVGVVVGREESKNFGLCRGEKRGGVVGMGRMVEWDRHHYPIYMHDCTSGVTQHHVQSKEWEVMPRLCKMGYIVMYNQIEQIIFYDA